MATLIPVSTLSQRRSLAWSPSSGTKSEFCDIQSLQMMLNMLSISTEDWSLTTGGTTPQKINSSMTQWLTGSKNPGLIILEHELSNQASVVFTFVISKYSLSNKTFTVSTRSSPRTPS